MHFVADENVPLASIRHLRGSGHTVRAIAEDAPSSTDAQVLARAVTERAVLLTFDRDYGELIYRQRAPIPAGLAGERRTQAVMHAEPKG